MTYETITSGRTGANGALLGAAEAGYNRALSSFLHSAAMTVDAAVANGEYKTARNMALKAACACGTYAYLDHKIDADKPTVFDVDNVLSCIRRVSALFAALAECPDLADEVNALVRSYLETIGDTFWTCTNHVASSDLASVKVAAVPYSKIDGICEVDAE